MSHSNLRIVVVALAVCTMSACQKTVAQPAPAPGGGQTAATTAAAATTATASKHTAADVAFMQGMIAHHAQAIEMVTLLKTRTTRDEMKLLGLRIEVSQNDEIATMREWLRARGAAVPDEHALHAHDAKLMPGMLTPAQMTQLTAAKGLEFDRLFLELMIQHHEGALTMVKELMATPGAAQDSSVFQFVADVEADQSAEINRMRAMRAKIGGVEE